MSLPERCPLCLAGREEQSVVTSHVYGDVNLPTRAFFVCQSCDVRYQYPALNPADEERFYAAEFEGFMAGRAGKDGGWLRAEEHVTTNEKTRQRRMRYLGPYLTGSLSVLEVGCSSGFMLYPLASAGHHCVGIEPSGLFGEFVKNRGLAIYSSLNELQRSLPTAEFDIILHFFVLEHISDPLMFLKTQLALLKPGGRIFFEIPNVADPLHSVYDIPEFERFYWSLAHPWYFSENSIEFLLTQLGEDYEIFLDQRYDLSNHITWARDGKPGGMGRFTHILGEEFEQKYKENLIRIGKCDTLVGMVRKKG